MTDPQEIIALTRPSSLNKPENAALRSRGVTVVAVDLAAIAAAYKPLTPAAAASASAVAASADRQLVGILEGADVVISTIFALNLQDQLPLIDAAKAAGVGRFVPSNFATVAPRGVMRLADAVRLLLFLFFVPSFPSFPFPISSSLALSALLMPKAVRR